MLTALLGAYGAYASGRRQRTLDEQAQQYQQQQVAQNQQQLDLQRQQVGVTEQQAGIDPATGQPYPFAVPKDLQQVMPNNHGQVADPITTAQARANQLQGIAIAALKANRPDLYTAYSTMARDAALNVGTLASAGLSNARSTEAYSKSDLDRAQAYGARELANDRVSIAAMHDQASMARTMANINSRQDITQYDNQTKVALAKYAAGVMITQKIPMQAAVQMAIAQLHANEQTYLQETNPKTQLLNPDLSAGAFQAGGPSINLNFGGFPGFQSNGQVPTFPNVPLPWANPNAPSWGPAPKPAAQTGVDKAGFDKVMATARQEFAKGVSIDTIRQQIKAAPKIDPATKAAILNALGPPQPGGSQAAPPFPLRP